MTVATIDANDGAPPPCSTNVDPCTVVMVPEAGAVYPTWHIDSEIQIRGAGTTAVNPHVPAYDASGADLGAVFDTTTMLQWQTALGANAGGFDLPDASAFCSGLPGGGWRVPTRIEIGTTQFRTNADMAQTTCVPPVFQSKGGEVLTQTFEPFGAPPNIYAELENRCGFLPGDPTAAAYVRCVKGDPKPATFVVNKSADLVWAVDTGLEWERTGALVHGYDEAIVHCNNVGMRMPVIQELYSIIDTRTKAMFDPTLFTLPPDGGAAARAILSQTVYQVIDGWPYYEGVSMYEGSQGEEDQASTADASDTNLDILVRCVRQH
jgi:hypothetical protein